MSPEELLGLGFSKELVVLIISMLPIFELRGALPVAINIFHFPWYYALPMTIIGNLLPVPIILLFLNAISKWLGKIGFFDRFFQWLFEHTKKRGEIVEKYGRIGLALFVAIPNEGRLLKNTGVLVWRCLLPSPSLLLAPGQAR